MNRQTTPHVWVLSTVTVLLSVASALSYMLHIGQGIIVGDLLGLPGREADVVLAQHRATYWLIGSLGCWAGSMVAAAFALPFFADASRLARLIGRFILASIFSLALTVLIGVLSFAVITSLHHSVVR